MYTESSVRKIMGFVVMPSLDEVQKRGTRRLDPWLAYLPSNRRQYAGRYNNNNNPLYAVRIDHKGIHNHVSE